MNINKGPLFTIGNSIYLKASFQLGQAPHIIIIVTGPPTVSGLDLNPGPVSLGGKCIPDWANKAR